MAQRHRHKRRARPIGERTISVRKADTSETEKAPLSTAEINDLPDTAFAVVLAGGKKDEDGKTVPRSLRVLPHHTGNVKGAGEHKALDVPRLRNALARLSQTDLTPAQAKKAKTHLERHADAVLPSRGGDPGKITDGNRGGAEPTKKSEESDGKLNPAQVGGPGLLEDEPRVDPPPIQESPGFPTRGIVVKESMIKFVLDGSKTVLVQPVKLAIGGQRLLMLSGKDPVGVVTLGKARKITAKQFGELEPKHLISSDTRKEWAQTQKGWGRAPFYAYPILKAAVVNPPKKKAKAASETSVAKIKDIENYDPAKSDDAMLGEDFRTLVAWAVTQEGDSKGFKHSAETIEALMVKLLVEAVKRGPKRVRFNPLGMRNDAREFFMRAAKKAKVPTAMLKPLSLEKKTDPGNLTDAELLEAHTMLHHWQRAEAFKENTVASWSTEEIVNMHVRVVEEMGERGIDHPPQPSDELDESSEEFEFDTSKALSDDAFTEESLEKLNREDIYNRASDEAGEVVQ